MKYQEQSEFINDLIENVRQDIIRESIKYPEEWDGRELRWRIADVFSDIVFGEIGKRKGKRYREFKNTILVNWGFR